jgi:predicted ester cyclase
MSNTEVIDRAWKLLDSQEFGRLEEVLAPNCEFRMGSQVFRGIAEFRAMCQGWWGAFPDLHHEVTAQHEAGNAYACELSMAGTHTGTMHTPQGDLPATGKKIRFLSCDYITVEKGKIVTWHAYPDLPGLMAQLQ